MKLFLILSILTFGNIHADTILNTQKENPLLLLEASEYINENTEDDFADEFNEEEPVEDPFRGYNEFMTDFNDKMIINFLNPVSQSYSFVFPEEIRTGISNAFHNIQYPIRLTNNLLQGKFSNSLDETYRFVLNTTIGMLGFLDPAHKFFEIERHDEDFGQTLGYYGIGPGYHIVLPFFGPSNFRDVVGLGVDSFYSPSTKLLNVNNPTSINIILQSTAVGTLYFVNKNSLESKYYIDLKKDAIELYPFFRDIYEMKRKAEINE